MCGEKDTAMIGKAADGGSPPHVRGKDNAYYEAEIEPRITPACAGKRILFWFKSFTAWDHPRMCGEKCRCFYFKR